MKPPPAPADAVHPWDAAAALVFYGARSFLVVGLPDDQGSIVLEWKARAGIRPASWISKGTSLATDPQTAVLGMVLGAGSLVPDALDAADRELRRMSAGARSRLGAQARAVRTKVVERARKNAERHIRRQKR